MANEHYIQLNDALAAHKAGNLKQAEQAYLSLIQENAYVAEATQLLGALYVQSDRAASAIPLLEKARNMLPDHLQVQLNLGTAYSRSGDLEKASAIYEQVLIRQPNYREALKNAASVAMKLGRFDVALPHLEKLSSIEELEGDLLLRMAICHARTGHATESIPLFEKYLESNPTGRHALAGLGNALLKQEGEWKKAIDCWSRFVEVVPDNAGAFNNLATALKNDKQYEAAIEACHRCLEIESEYFPGLCNLGIALASARRYPEALDTLLRAVRRYDQICSGEKQESAKSLEVEEKKLVEFACVAYCQLASLSNLLRKVDEAFEFVDKGLRLKDDDTECRMMRGFLNLQVGNYEKGWPDYEWRKKRKEGQRGGLRAREWRGPEDRVGTLLVHYEQGLGDTLHFCRYLPLLGKYVDKVLFLCQKPLVPLLENSPLACSLIPEGEPLPAHDAQISLLSLPWLFGTTMESIPNEIPYLKARPDLVEHWRGQLEGLQGLKIGIAWQGNSEFAMDHLRSVPLEHFSKLAACENVQLISLQKGEGLKQIEEVKFPIVQFPEIDSESGAFMDTSAIMRNLDVVVSSDTATIHLAGALGVRTWLACSFASEWRWGTDSAQYAPWYPQIRLFRQPEPGDWEPVFQSMATALSKLQRQKPSQT